MGRGLGKRASVGSRGPGTQYPQTQRNTLHTRLAASVKQIPSESSIHGDGWIVYCYWVELHNAGDGLQEARGEEAEERAAKGQQGCREQVSRIQSLTTGETTRERLSQRWRKSQRPVLLERRPSINSGGIMTTFWNIYGSNAFVAQTIPNATDSGWLPMYTMVPCCPNRRRADSLQKENAL